MSDKTKLMDHATQLRQIRRANNGALACFRLLNQDTLDSSGIPTKVGANIALEHLDRCGLLYAMEACCRLVDFTFEEIDSAIDDQLAWDDDYNPEYNQECADAHDLLEGKTTYDELLAKGRFNGRPSVPGTEGQS